MLMLVCQLGIQTRKAQADEMGVDLLTLCSNRCVLWLVSAQLHSEGFFLSDFVLDLETSISLVILYASCYN